MGVALSVTPPTPLASATAQGLVKQFFNEKEVTSTLVMDALVSGCRQIAEHSQRWAKVRAEYAWCGPEDRV